MFKESVTPTLERDPVCGMNVNPESAKYTAEHAGKKYYFCCGGCADKFMFQPQAYANKAASGLVTLGMPAPNASPGLVVLGGPAKPAASPAVERDPVCGMNVNPATAKFTHEQAGKKYYFCCGGCLEKFKADPDKY